MKAFNTVFLVADFLFMLNDIRSMINYRDSWLFVFFTAMTALMGQICWLQVNLWAVTWRGLR